MGSVAPKSAHASSLSWMKLKTELDDDCSWSLAIVDAFAIDVAVGSESLWKWSDELQMGQLCFVLNTLENGRQREWSTSQAGVQVLDVEGDWPWQNGSWPVCEPILQQPYAWDGGRQRAGDKC